MADNQDMTKVGVSHIELDAENIDAGRNISMIGLVLIVKITAGYICNFFWIMLFVIYKEMSFTSNLQFLFSF